jgi:hypothetical protein
MIALKLVSGGILAPDIRKKVPVPTSYIGGIFRFATNKVIPVTYKRYRKY